MRLGPSFDYPIKIIYKKQYLPVSIKDQSDNFKKIQIISLIGIFLAFVVVGLGAWTRLVDAGLGCPDWPGCYGHLWMPVTESEIKQANVTFPERQFELAKAVPEVVHRYFAGTLGLLIFGLFFLAIFSKIKDKRLNNL